ncbi:MAG: hypothetical protein IJD22_02630 [Clostridia bacterium]|nr:hypothetical protein [Clostridia bacterium]
MTDITVYHSRIIRFRAILGTAIIAALCLGVIVGGELQTVESCIIVPRPTFSEHSFFSAAVRICIWDMVCFWVLSLPLNKSLRVASSTVLFFFRGAVIGSVWRTFFENTVSNGATGILGAYLAVTLLCIIYDGYLNTGGEKSGLCRLISCLAVTGAAAVIRIMPMLLYK